MRKEIAPDCFRNNRARIIGGVMRSPWIMGLCFALSAAPVGLLAQTHTAASGTQARHVANKAQKELLACKDQAAPAFTLANKDDKVVINGREWVLGDLRPAWALDQKSAPHNPTRSSRIRAPRSRAAQVSSPHRSH